MMKSLPTISVITVTFNCCETIELTILNVLKQTYPYLEYIVIDGGSTDGTVDVIKRYAHKLTYWVSEPDKGIYDAMNKGARAATGEWLLFRNSGDYFFSSTTIQDVFQWYSDQGEDFVYGGMRLFVTEAYKDTYYKPQKDDIWRSAWFPHPASFIRRTTQLRIPYPTDFRVSSDYYFFQKLMLEGARYQMYSGIITLFDNETGISSTTYLGCKESTEVLKRLGAPTAVINRNRRDYYSLCLRGGLIKLMRLTTLLWPECSQRIHADWVKQPKSVTLQNI